MNRTFLTILFSLSLAIFSACSDDDKAPWQELPTGPITGADAMLTFNGDRSYGTLTVDAHDAQSGTIALSNVIPGYPEIIMDVELDEQPDGSFTLKGTKNLNTPPAMLPDSRADAPSSIYTLTAEGTVSPDGKAAVAVTSALTTKAEGRLAGTWVPGRLLPLAPEAMPEASVVVSLTGMESSPETAKIGPTLSLILGNLVYQTIKSVSFNPDGNVTATITREADFLKMMSEGIDKTTGTYSPVAGTWETSGKNMMFWYCAGDMLMLTPYVPNILDQIMIDNGRDPNENDGAMAEIEKILIGKLTAAGVDTDALITLFAKINKTGFPIMVAENPSGISLVLTKKMLDPIVKPLLPALPALDAKLDAMIAANPDDKTLAMITQELFPQLSIEHLSDLAGLWNNADDITITLNLIASSPKQI